MTNKMIFIGMAALIVIAVVLPVYSQIEPAKQEEIQSAYYVEAIVSATDYYAENCAVCHGAAGQGIGDNPPLNTDGIRSMSESDLAKVITRGRDNTVMAAWAVDEGGIFSNFQINDFVTFIQQVNWSFVETRVAELGLTPPEMIEMEVSDEMISLVLSLDGGEDLAVGLVVYAENCAACHGANGSGTVIAPAIDTEDLRSTPIEETIELINIGVPGTLMPSWQNLLLSEQVTVVTDLIYRWPEILLSGIEFPEVDIVNIVASPEVIDEGRTLFNIACKTCHGTDGYGTRMAPALNNQIFLSETPDAAIYLIIGGGIAETMMPAWGSRLNDYDLQILVAYLRSLEETAPVIVSPILNP